MGGNKQLEGSSREKCFGQKARTYTNIHHKHSRREKNIIFFFLPIHFSSCAITMNTILQPYIPKWFCLFICFLSFSLSCFAFTSQCCRHAIMPARLAQRVIHTKGKASLVAKQYIISKSSCVDGSQRPTKYHPMKTVLSGCLRHVRSNNDIVEILCLFGPLAPIQIIL